MSQKAIVMEMFLKISFHFYFFAPLSDYNRSKKMKLAQDYINIYLYSMPYYIED